MPKTQKSASEDAATANVAPPISSITGFALEAIFHPKFENENREIKGIRNEMMSKVTEQVGYLEVSLKHSGTLLLWSGGQRYYSKNAIDNAFTVVGEVILRQHFHRSWYEESNTTGQIMYQECSQYVESHNLTLAFELVTAVLGHHGEIPKKDFLILTAVAEKTTPRFYSTIEILQLAQRFRLPHNDLWTFSTVEAVDQLFSLYDSTRETALATGTVHSLSTIANFHVPCMYPHAHFQGEILEGFVVRYVSYNHKEREEQADTLRTLAQGSHEILKQVPIDRAMAYELHTECEVEIMSLNIRRLWEEEFISKGIYKDVTLHLGTKVSQALHNTDSVRRTVSKQPPNMWNIPNIARLLLDNQDADNNTKMIAKLLVTLNSLTTRVKYAVFRENDSRWLCTIHILLDSTFAKFQKKTQSDDLKLFRGFSIELKSHDSNGNVTNTSDVNNSEIDMEMLQIDNNSQLMLKMKLIPYMVRTFCCRNGLKTMASLGLNEYESYTWRQMTSWGISDEAKMKWQDFFTEWGKYCQACMENRATDVPNVSLPPIGEEFYLHHLEHFLSFYEGEKRSLQSSDIKDSVKFRGLIVVVANVKQVAKQVASFMSRELGGSRPIIDIIGLTKANILDISRVGIIAYAMVTDNYAKLRKIIKEFSEDVSLIFFGCQITQTTAESSPNTKRIKGNLFGWRATHVARVKDVDVADSVDITTDISDIDIASNTSLHEIIDEIKNGPVHFSSTSDEVPGLLVFFPSIPGCGKSTITGKQTQSLLVDALRCDPMMNKRELIVLSGDDNKKNFWPLLTRHRSRQSSCILIADKNTPKNVWSRLGNVLGKGIAVPVFPDKVALSDTHIQGIISPSGNTDTSVNHQYPFSLQYLAVCISRVLERPARSHIGGLDSSLELTCFIIVKFFGFYRNIAADSFMDQLRDEVQKSGSECSESPIEIPFFRSGDIPELPSDLNNIVIQALQLQYGYELERKDTDSFMKKDSKVLSIEKSLREIISKHQTYLSSITTTEEESHQSFVKQMMLQVQLLNNMSTEKFEGKEVISMHYEKIGLVAIDVSQPNVVQWVKIGSA